MQYNKGDRVKCIDPVHLLNKNKIYTVENSYENYDHPTIGIEVIKLVDIGCLFLASRFIKSRRKARGNKSDSDFKKALKMNKRLLEI